MSGKAYKVEMWDEEKREWVETEGTWSTPKAAMDAAENLRALARSMKGGKSFQFRLKEVEA